MSSVALPSEHFGNCSMTTKREVKIKFLASNFNKLGNINQQTVSICDKRINRVGKYSQKTAIDVPNQKNSVKAE